MSLRLCGESSTHFPLSFGASSNPRRRIVCDLGPLCCRGNDEAASRFAFRLFGTFSVSLRLCGEIPTRFPLSFGASSNPRRRILCDLRPLCCRGNDEAASRFAFRLFGTFSVSLRLCGEIPTRFPLSFGASSNPRRRILCDLGPLCCRGNDEAASRFAFRLFWDLPLCLCVSAVRFPPHSSQLRGFVKWRKAL